MRPFYSGVYMELGRRGYSTAAAQVLGYIQLFAVLVAVLSALGGCAGPWTRPGASSVDLAADQRQCEYEAAVAVAAVNDPIRAGIREGLLGVSCMKAKGWNR